jgi:hypothetical protein
MTNPPKPYRLQRVIFAVIGLGIVAFGVGTLVNGYLHYQNWWGGLVFAPFAILIGTSALLIAAFRPDVFRQPTKKRSRIQGWPTGKARYHRNRD